MTVRVSFEGKDTMDICDQMWDFINCAIAQPIAGQPLERSDGDPEPDTSTEQTQPAKPSKPAANSDLTVEDVASALKAHMKKHGKDSAIAILAEFDAKRASDVIPDQRGAIVERLQS